MDIKEAAKTILEAIPEGYVFDSHYVIDELLGKEEFTDAYLVLASNYANSNRPTLTTHQQIGHIINKYKGTLVERMNNESWSMTIHRRGGKCASWRRI